MGGNISPHIQQDNHDSVDSWLTLSLTLPSPQPSHPSSSSPQQQQPPPQEKHSLSLTPQFSRPPPRPFMLYQMPEQELLPRNNFSFNEDIQQQHQVQEFVLPPCRAQARSRRQSVRPKKKDKADTIGPPFPWATSKRAVVYSLDQLVSNGLTTISGTVQCKVCEVQRDIEFNLREKFDQVAGFIAENRYDMHDRAPSDWMNPVLPNCVSCGQENVMRPLITKKRTINWLFLLLGQMIGCCKLSQLKYFCKHTKNHRTGAKDRLLYLTYLGLCKQLHPEGPFDP